MLFISRVVWALPAVPAAEAIDLSDEPGVVRHTLERITIPAAVSGRLHITLQLSAQQKLLPGYPGRYSIKHTSANGICVSGKYVNGYLQTTHTMIPFQTTNAEQGLLEVHATYGYCEGSEELCIPRCIIWRIPYIIGIQGTTYLECIDKP